MKKLGAPRKEIVFDHLKDWVLEYFSRTNKAPRMEDFYIQLGAPYNKMSILREYGSLKKLYDLIGIKQRSVTSEEEKETLLNRLKDLVYQHKTTDRDILRKKGLKDRSVYERLFGSWSNALRDAGIREEERCLLRYFPDYRGENYVEFLKNKIGENDDFTETQYEIIDKAKRIGNNVKLLRKSFNFNRIKKHFHYLSILQIICGLEINLNYKSGKVYEANDGHICESQQEMELDNWLYENGFAHEVHIQYPNSKMVCDFKVGDHYIEFAGLMNTQSNKYRNKILKKISFCKENNLLLHVIDKLSDDNLSVLRSTLIDN